MKVEELLMRTADAFHNMADGPTKARLAVDLFGARLDPQRLGLSLLVFVEVRLRRHTRYGGALASVDWRKQRKLARAALAWAQQHRDHAGRRRAADEATGGRDA